MSRVGKMPIAIPAGVTVELEENTVTAKGPKGELSYTFNPEMTVTVDENEVRVTRPSDIKTHRAVHGLTRSMLANAINGVSTGFEKVLEIVGVGYRAEQDGEKLVLRMGFSHLVNVEALPGLKLVAEANNRIKVSGSDKQVVGEMAARIRAIRPPDSYKGKGIRYQGEYVRLKPGKAGKVASG
ncbi:50S ribosomal protein L6 [Chloroflexota bacterium]